MPAAALSDSGNLSSSTVSSSSCATCLAIGHGSTVTLWDYSTGQTLVNFNHVNSNQEKGKDSSLDDDNYLFSDLEFSPNGQVIATSSLNSQNVFLSRASTGSLLAKIDVPSIEQSTAAAAAADLGSTVSQGGVTSLNFGGGGRYMSFSTCYKNSSSGSSKVYIFNLAKMKWVRSFSVEPEFLCTKVCFDPNNTFLAALSTKSDEGTSTGTNALTLWNVREGKIVTSLHYPYRMPTTNNNSYILPPKTMRKLENRGAMQFSSLIPHYCAVGCGSSVLLYDLHRSTGVKSPFSSVAATNGPNLNSSTSSEPLLNLKDRHNGFVTDIAFNPMARSLFASSSITDGCVKFHDIVTNKTIQTIYPPDKSNHNYADSPTCLKFHSNGVTFATGTIMGDVHVYDLRKIDSSTSPYLSKNAHNFIDARDRYLNAIVGTWNTPQPGDNFSTVPVSHICFQEQLPPKKVKTSPMRPSSAAGNSPSQEDSKHIAILRVGSDGGEGPVKGQDTSFQESIDSQNGNLGIASSITVGVVQSKLEPPLSSISKPQESLNLHDEALHFTAQSASASLQGTSETLDAHHAPTPSESQAGDESIKLPQQPLTRSSFNFDLVDANLDRLMKSIRLGPPLKSAIGDEQAEWAQTRSINTTRQSNAPQQPFSSYEYKTQGIAEDTEKNSSSDRNTDKIISRSSIGASNATRLFSSAAYRYQNKAEEAEKYTSSGKNGDKIPSVNSSEDGGVPIHVRSSSEYRSRGKAKKTEKNLPIGSDNNITLSKLDLQQLIEDVTFELREELGQSIRNLHVDLLRQFQLQSDEIAETFQQQKEVMMALIEENQKLRNENEWLRREYSGTS